MAGALIDNLGTEHLRFERRGPVGWCIVDRPVARNALTTDMYLGIGRAIRLTTDDPELQALVITGVGDVFIPGGDMNIDAAVPGDAHAPGDVLPFAALRRSQVPVVAAVNGICQASGLLIAMLADVAVASDQASFRAPELRRGFPDMWYAAVLPAHVGVGRARELMMSARTVNAREAVAIGLVERVVEHDRLVVAAQETVYELLEAAPQARRMWKQAVNSRYGVIDEMTLDAAPTYPEVEEGFAAFLEKRRPTWSPVVPNTPRVPTHRAST